MIILAISGKKYSGKNALANAITNIAACTTEQFAFAHRIKAEVAKAFDTTTAEIETNKPMYREILQAWGSLRRQRDGIDYFVEKVFRKLTRTNAELVMITDVRFYNEIELLKQANAHTIRIHRMSTMEDNHISETALDDYKFDYIVDNNNDLYDLQKKAIELCKHFNIPTK
jgi:hypothetical protein